MVRARDPLPWLASTTRDLVKRIRVLEERLLLHNLTNTNKDPERPILELCSLLPALQSSKCNVMQEAQKVDNIPDESIDQLFAELHISVLDTSKEPLPDEKVARVVARSRLSTASTSVPDEAALNEFDVKKLKPTLNEFDERMFKATLNEFDDKKLESTMKKDLVLEDLEGLGEEKLKTTMKVTDKNPKSSMKQFGDKKLKSTMEMSDKKLLSSMKEFKWNVHAAEFVVEHVVDDAVSDMSTLCKFDDKKPESTMKEFDDKRPEPAMDDLIERIAQTAADRAVAAVPLDEFWEKHIGTWKANS